MKTKGKYIFYGILLIAVFSCNKKDMIIEYIADVESKNIVLHEKKYARYLSSKENVIKLIGYQTIYAKNQEEREHNIFVGNIISRYDLDKISMDDKDAYSGTVYIPEDGAFTRFYMGLHTAIIEYDGRVIAADEMGTVNNTDIQDIKKIKVIGRKKSASVYGTGSNIIEKDRILLKTPLEINGTNDIFKGYIHEGSNIVIFNLGEKILEDNHLLRNDGNVSCMQNHGGINCSAAFGIDHGRCVMATNRCMDYNGFGTDCSGSKAYFVGSDCCEALCYLHCWNEIMY
jgi:hypothetical protein